MEGSGSVDRAVLEQALAARIAELEATPYEVLWEKYTEEGEYRTWRWWRYRRVRGRVGRTDLRGELDGSDGSRLHLCEWAWVGDDRALHLFVEVWSESGSSAKIADGMTVVRPGVEAPAGSS